jgi:hypothetical protein
MFINFLNEINLLIMNTLPITKGTFTRFMGSSGSDQMLPHITETINQSALKCFGLKVKKKNRGKKRPRHVIDLINAKNVLAKDLANKPGILDPKETKQLQAQIKDAKATILLGRRNHVRSKLLLADPTRKRFWRFLKSQTKAAGQITALQDKDNKMVFNQDELEEVVMHQFSKIFEGKRHPIYPTIHPLDQTDISLHEINQILSQSSHTFKSDHFEEQVCPPYTFLELEETLGNLQAGKASGYDRVPNELLKNSSFNFKQYLLIFLNKILDDGSVPQRLNEGKCMLIYKVVKMIKTKNITLMFSQF